MTLPFLTTLILPCHGVFTFLHGGCVRPGGGLDGLNRPPNDWDTFGTYPTTAVVSLPSAPFWICSGHWSWIAWRLLSRWTTPPPETWYPGLIERGRLAWAEADHETLTALHTINVEQLHILEELEGLKQKNA